MRFSAEEPGASDRPEIQMPASLDRSSRIGRGPLSTFSQASAIGSDHGMVPALRGQESVPHHAQSLAPTLIDSDVRDDINVSLRVHIAPIARCGIGRAE